jgi:hypothetical protein
MFDIEPARLRGLKLATIGILIAVAGAGIAFLCVNLGAEQNGVLKIGALIGWIIGWIGGLTVLAGLLWHLFLMFQHFTHKK